MKAASLALQQRSDYPPQRQHKTMTTVAADFDRSNPLFERNIVSFEVVTTQTPNNNNASCTNNNKHNDNFTVRILEGRRSASSGGGEGERVIRFEMSNECNLVGDSLPTHHKHQCTPSQSSRTPIIHAPFMTVDRGGQGHHSTMMQGGPNHHNHQSPHKRLQPQPQQKSLNLPIELYELEVGESDFAALRRDQALLVDFNSFSDSLISLLQCCELGSDEGGCSSTHQQTFQDTTSNQYGQQQQPYDESASGGWNGDRQGGGASRQSMTGQQPWGSINNNNGSWSTPSHHQGQGGGMNYHGQRMMSSPFAKMNCSTSMPVSTYACRLEVDASSNDSTSNSMQQWRQPNNNSLHARFSIVESNQFRELTHLALNLNVGTDKSVRCYLSSRYVCYYVEVYLLFIYDSAFYITSLPLPLF